jgi:inosose dehydratase
MARVACSPLNWHGVLYEHVLDDVAGAGYAGVEAHSQALTDFARQAPRLRGLLDDRTLTLTAVPFTGTYFEREEWKDEVERLRRVADFLAEASTEGIVVFRTVPHPARRDMQAGQPPLLPLDANRMGRLAETLNRYGDLCLSFGLRGAVANRVGSYLETPDEMEAVLERTEPDLVRLAPDVGHWVYAGGAPATLIRTHRDRLLYPRLKDFDRAVFDKTCEEHLGFPSFVRAGGFKELGAGDLDLAAELMPLENAEWDGWVCVELEMSETHTPRESATISRDYLREHLHW